MTPRSRRAAGQQHRVSEAVTARQAAHRAWGWFRAEVRAIEHARPGDAEGYWHQALAWMTQAAVAVPSRHPPAEFANRAGTFPHTGS